MTGPDIGDLRDRLVVLRAERDRLRRELDDANAELHVLKSTEDGRVVELESELAACREAHADALRELAALRAEFGVTPREET